VFVRHLDGDNLALHEGVRIFIAQAYERAAAPPPCVDDFLHGTGRSVRFSAPPKPG
jgi:hypothetical protein